ncbi:hypothetical protein BN1708_003336, partial [Verticillium longisporum]
ANGSTQFEPPGQFLLAHRGVGHSAPRGAATPTLGAAECKSQCGRIQTGDLHHDFFFFRINSIKSRTSSDAAVFKTTILPVRTNGVAVAPKNRVPCATSLPTIHSITNPRAHAPYYLVKNGYPQPLGRQPALNLHGAH